MTIVFLSSTLTPLQASLRAICPNKIYLFSYPKHVDAQKDSSTHAILMFHPCVVPSVVRGASPDDPRFGVGCESDTIGVPSTECATDSPPSASAFARSCRFSEIKQTVSISPNETRIAQACTYPTREHSSPIPPALLETLRLRAPSAPAIVHFAVQRAGSYAPAISYA